MVDTVVKTMAPIIKDSYYTPFYQSSELLYFTIPKLILKAFLITYAG